MTKAKAKPDGLFIVYEGISGCGKSESIKRLAERLSRQGHAPVIVEWNSIERIRSAIARLEAVGWLTPAGYSVLQWLSFMLSYSRTIVPSLKRNGIVVADRYVYTAITRDAANGARIVPGKWLRKRFRQPDLIVYYDLPAHLCYERIQSRGKALFHTNKAIKKSRTIPNKDLFYLERLHREYRKLFDDAEEKERLPILRVLDQDRCADERIAQSVLRKLSNIGHAHAGAWLGGEGDRDEFAVEDRRMS
ncbi:dTMP kinase [Paenibacillaceae bacterium WGS1546]|uniref:dTMP kinase n=1 Tax=Cohnella sp. WGS1546 TaxID=3366810 RepID=UPI00372D2157